MREKICLFLGILFITIAISVFPVNAADFSVTGYAQPDDAWRVASGLHAKDLKIDWYRQTKGTDIVDGYDVLLAHSLKNMKVQYKQNHRSNQNFDTQELAAMGTLYGIGFGVARSWIGELWEDPKWMAKAQFSLDRKYLSVGVDWASSFAGRRSWSISPRVKIPAYRTLSFVLMGKWQETKSGDVMAKWWSIDGGLSVELPELMEKK